MIIGSVFTLGLFINHFMIIRNKTKTMWRIKINQIIIVMLIINIKLNMSLHIIVYYIY